MKSFKTYLFSVSALLFCALFTTSTSEAIEPQPYFFNVYALGNIGSASQPYGSDFQGPAAMGGSGYFSNFSGNLLGPSLPYSMYAGGTFSLNSGSINNGGIEAGGNIILNSVNISGNINGGGNLLGAPPGGYGTVYGNVNISGTNSSNLTITGTVNTHQSFSPTVNLTNASHFFQNASHYWGNLASTATFQNVYGQLQVSNLVGGRNIVNLTLADLNNAYGIQLTGPSDAFVVFNITDFTSTSELLKALSFALSGGITSDDILFNLINATSIELNGGNYVSILAPQADIQFPSGVLTGNLIADNLYGAGQVNQGVFTGFIHDQNYFGAPEPASYLMMGTFLLMAGYLARRRKLQSVLER